MRRNSDCRSRTCPSTSKISLRVRVASPRSSTRGWGTLLKKNKVDVIMARGGLDRWRQTGGRPTPREMRRRCPRNTSSWRRAPGHGLCRGWNSGRASLIWTYKEAMVPETMPKSLLVIGSGAPSVSNSQALFRSGCGCNRGRSHGSRPAGGGRGNLRDGA